MVTFLSLNCTTRESDTNRGKKREREYALFTCFHQKSRSSSTQKLEVLVVTDKLWCPFANKNIDRPTMKKLRSRNIGHTVGSESTFRASFCSHGDGAGASDGRKADKTRERLVFTGRGQGCGTNMKFFSKQPFSIKMNYICRERSVGGIAEHVAKIFLLCCCCLFNWKDNGCVFNKRDSHACREVMWTCGLRVIFLSATTIISQYGINSRLTFHLF